MDHSLGFTIITYVASVLVGALLWSWKESAKKATRESGVNNAIEALKIEMDNYKDKSDALILDTKRYLEDKITYLQNELKDQKEEKKMMELNIYKKVASVETVVNETAKGVNHIKVMIAQIATVQKIELKNFD